MLLVSCQSEIWNSGVERTASPDIIAQMETDLSSKSLISVNETGEGTIYWTPADEINIFYGTTSTHYISQNTVNATTAVFRTTDVIGSTESASTNIWGLYPYDEEAACSGTVVTTTLPATQLGVPETFDDNLFITLAHSATTSLKFFNVCGGIKFSLSRDDITSVSFKGNNNEDIAGDISLTFENDLPKATVVNGLKEVTLTPKTGTTFAAGVNYYLIVLPGTLSGGFTMTFTASDGSIGTFNYTTKAITIKRSIFSKKAEIDTFASFVEVPVTNNEIYYTSTDGNVVMPFATDVFGANIVSNNYAEGQGVIVFDRSVTSVGDYAFTNCSTLSSVTIPESVSQIGDYAFCWCTSLEGITLPDNVLVIGEGAFSNCVSLAFVNIPDGVSHINSGTFFNCALQTVQLPSSILSIGNKAFKNCRYLSSIIIPEGVSGIEMSTFEDCDLLASVTLPESITYIYSYAFKNCESLSEIIIHDDCTVISSFAFMNCSSLQRVVIGAGVQIIYNSAFAYCSNISELIIGEGLEEIGNAAFVGCDSISSIELKSNIKKIGENAFKSCSALRKLVIGESITSIGYYAFEDCSSLEEVIIYAPTPTSSPYRVFNNTNNCPIFVPKGSVQAYKSVWIDYSGRIQAIDVPAPEAIDLGLSVKWASFNLDASKAEDIGSYYAWGECAPKDCYNWNTYKWCEGSQESLSKYCYDPSYGYNGYTDSKLTLDLEDDAANYQLGTGWRMPTKAEYEELISNCNVQWTDDYCSTGIAGFVFTSNSTSNYIFLPTTGHMDNALVSYNSQQIWYWTSSLATAPDDLFGPRCSYELYFYNGTSTSLKKPWLNDSNRYNGAAIRPVFALID